MLAGGVSANLPSVFERAGRSKTVALRRGGQVGGSWGESARRSPKVLGKDAHASEVTA